jgi:hypothetical protein
MPTRGFGLDVLFGEDRRTTRSAARPTETPNIKTEGQGQTASPDDPKQPDSATTGPREPAPRAAKSPPRFPGF